ncbi:hypothetical protein KIF59_08695 [Enterobacter cloacae subsp. cloacae]|nr:hypothetical protein [Enterobacter cloacae subsp. cloacae]
MNLIEGNDQLRIYLCRHAFLAVRAVLWRWVLQGRDRALRRDAACSSGAKPLLQSFRAIAGNRPLFILCIANLCTLGAFNVKSRHPFYYTQYVRTTRSCCLTWVSSAWAVFLSASL